MSSITATIVIPVYNGETTLAAALDSALAQNFSDFEVIVVDDGSTDATAEIVRSYNDERLRIHTQPNGGLNAARNSGIRLSRGRYIGLLDADDLWEADKLALHVAHLDERPFVGLSFSPSRFIDEEGKPTGLTQSPKTHAITPRDLICFNPVGNGSAPVLRREALDDIAHQHPKHGHICWFDEELRQSTDIECWMRLVLKTEWQVEGIPQILTLYRVNPHGLSANVVRQYETWLQMLRSIACYAPDFVAEHGDTARAWQLRYLARRAVSLRQGGLAWSFARESLRASPDVLRAQPLKTITTLGAAGVLRWAGPSIYERCEKLLLNTRRNEVAA